MLDNLSDNDGVSKVLTKELKCGDIAYISEDMSYMEGVMLIMECMDRRRGWYSDYNQYITDR